MNSNNQTKRRQPREKRWMPAHLPVGTIVEVVFSHGAKHGQPQQFTVLETKRNGPRSFVVITPEHNDELDVPVGFNTSWITRIVKRGEGGPSFQNDKLACLTKQRLKRECDRRNDTIYAIHSSGYNPNMSNNYVQGWTRDVVELLVRHCNMPLADTEILDYDKVHKLLCAQTFVIDYTLTGDLHGIISLVVKKKKAKAWFKRNFRKFLASTRKLEKNEAEVMNSMHDEDLDWE